MLMTVAEFREQVQGSPAALIARLQMLTGRRGDEEAAAWRASLPKLAEALSAPALASLHVYFAGAGYLTIEYQLPAASSWCDVVLLGRRDSSPSALVLELKDWLTRGDRPGPYEGLMERHGSIVLHPSEQVRGYVEYCRRFHSAIQDYQADVRGCVFFTRDHFANGYSQKPNDRLTREYPFFTMAPQVVREALPQYLTGCVNIPDREFATAFIKGRYRQDRGFVRQIGSQILDPGNSPFELLDHQRRAYALVRARLEDTVFSGTLRKQVVLIEGPPGSGKSVLAARIWARLVTHPELPEGSAVLTTTSTAQNSNWTGLFAKADRGQAASGVIKRAASYTPITTQTLGRLRRQHGKGFASDPSMWRENVQLLRDLGIPFQDGAQDEQYLVSVVDEAHALINPERPEGRGQFGFAPTLGPLAWHIIRASTLSIFLLDSEQGFRDRENTTVDDIRRWAAELGAEITDQISLEGAQFRCAGSTEYVAWVEAVLRGDQPEQAAALAQTWRQVLDFEVLDTPAALEAALRERLAEGRNARLVASYAREWKTRGAANPHALPPQMMDFHERYVDNGRTRYWSRIWNFIPLNGTDYTWYVQALPGSPMHDDPLFEVGCPYAVRGFDFDYVGVLWLDDLVWRDGRWTVDLEHVHDTGLLASLREARSRGPDGPGFAQLRRGLAQAYRILLTRGIYGTCIWFQDQETREYVLRCLGQ
jgi:hypothetical protein